MVYELTYRPLDNASNWRQFSRGQINNELLIPEKEVGCFLVLHSSHLLHETVNLPAQSLEVSWSENFDYYKNKENKPAPIACHPIYLISVDSGINERVVYIGKTSSSSSRFSSGHKAISRLHAPKYDGLKKRLYRCCVVFLNNTNELPIEWVQPFSYASDLLNLFESYLIYCIKPELNVQHVNNNVDFNYGQVHVQNVTGDTLFLHDNSINS